MNNDDEISGGESEAPPQGGGVPRETLRRRRAAKLSGPAKAALEDTWFEVWVACTEPGVLPEGRLLLLKKAMERLRARYL